MAICVSVTVAVSVDIAVAIGIFLGRFLFYFIGILWNSSSIEGKRQMDDRLLNRLFIGRVLLDRYYNSTLNKTYFKEIDMISIFEGFGAIPYVFYISSSYQLVMRQERKNER